MQLKIETIEDYAPLVGMNDRNIAVLEQALSVSITLIGNSMTLQGEEKDVNTAAQCIRKLSLLTAKGEKIDPPLIRHMVLLAGEGRIDELDEILSSSVTFNYRGKTIRCKTMGQIRYVQSVRENELTIVSGPAGTGKTYLAMALAADALKKHDTERIILTRPAVEAGEKLGFLPGDMSQKVDPYLRPLFDALYEILGPDSVQRLTDRGVLEIAPLAFMRGRTLSNAFIILDEAQNTTEEQMKMFLTRIGENSRCIVTGDITQIDLPRGRNSGMKEAVRILKGIESVGIISLDSQDVVRSDLVSRIVEAYERDAQRQSSDAVGHEVSES